MTPSVAPSHPQLLIGPRALEQSASIWRELERKTEAVAFQRHAWAGAWVEHLAGRGSPWIVLTEGTQGVLWPLFLRRRAGFRVLGMLGEGVSDYLAPLGDAGATHAALALIECLRDNARHYDLLDLGSLSLADSARGALRNGLGHGTVERIYERCPVIDTTGSWEDFLRTRRKKFRANLKRAVRRVEAHGSIALAVEESNAGVLSELEAVERESWKWASGTAYLQPAGRRAFLRSVLLDPGIASEIWTCRADGELAGFAVVFPTSRSRYYYLPSFRARFSDVGTCLLSEIVQQSFASGYREVDLLQGDESYKLAWATGERTVHELASPGGGLLAPASILGIRLRWELAGSDLARRIRSRFVSWRGRRSEG